MRQTYPATFAPPHPSPTAPPLKLALADEGSPFALGAAAPLRRQALIELTLLLAALFTFLWTDSRQILPKTARSALAVVVGAVVVALLLRLPFRPRWRSFRRRWARRQLQRGLLLLVLGTALAAAAMAGVGWLAGTLGKPPGFTHWISRNWYLEGAQQVVLQWILVPRLAVLLGGAGVRVSAIAAVLFALLHAPNPILTAITFPAGFLWCEWHRRYRSLPAIWLSHIVLGIVAFHAFDTEWLRRMRVGIAYIYFQ